MNTILLAQQALNKLNKYPQLSEDGKPGPLTKDVVRSYQRDNGLTVDGIIGPQTLKLLLSGKEEDVPFLKISQRAFDLYIHHEITSEAIYIRDYMRPSYPGLNSGITIGIGYDLGYNTVAQIREDWEDLVSKDTLNKLISVAGLKGLAAKNALSKVAGVSIPFNAAKQVFLERTLPRFADLAMKAYPGLELLEPDAIGAIVSLVFNRGNDLYDDKSDKNRRRKEMAAIRPLVPRKDYAGIAAQLRSMKRLWDGVPNYDGAQETRAAGLVRRREDEAVLLENAVRVYSDKEVIKVYLSAA